MKSFHLLLSKLSFKIMVMNQFHIFFVELKEDEGYFIDQEESEDRDKFLYGDEEDEEEGETFVI